MNFHEQRRTPRKRVSLSAYVEPENAALFHLPVRSQVLNLNRTGAMIHLDEFLLAGERCAMTLIADDGANGIVDARVVWSARDAAGAYNAGVVFRNLTPDQEYLIDLQLVRQT